MLPSLDGMTADQQIALIASMEAMIEPVRERGIEFIVMPDWGQKVIVVSRGDLPEHADHGSDATHNGRKTQQKGEQAR